MSVFPSGLKPRKAIQVRLLVGTSLGEDILHIFLYKKAAARAFSSVSTSPQMLSIPTSLSAAGLLPWLRSAQGLW